MNKYFSCTLFVCLLIANFGAGCRHGRPPRKTFPNGIGSQEEEARHLNGQNSDNLQIFFGDTVVNAMGSRQQLFLVELPDARCDSIARNIVHDFEPLEAMVIDFLHQQRKTGAVIDFRESQVGEIQSREFVASYGSPKLQKFALIFIWDRFSFSRAKSFMDFAAQLPGIVCTAMNKGTDPGCFENAPMAF